MLCKAASLRSCAACNGPCPDDLKALTSFEQGERKVALYSSSTAFVLMTGEIREFKSLQAATLAFHVEVNKQ